MNLILGAGLAVLSASWHLHHRDCVILEKSDVIGGHARSIIADGFTLDHGPHISFTRHDYVRTFFARHVTDAGADPASPVGSMVMAGRFAHWKYFWTDDCVLRGRQIATTSAGHK
jgi:phytoene dehydrogenase-like protein